MKVRSIFVVLLLAFAMSAGSLATSAAPAQAASCNSDGRPKSDGFGGWWPTGWVCPNRSGAGVYVSANYSVRVGTMYSNPSWFVCYWRGASHAGGNNVWYYTQADVAAPGQGHWRGWGFMAAVDLGTHIDPWPGIPPC